MEFFRVGLSRAALLVVVLVAWAYLPTVLAQGGKVALMVEIDGAIGPAIARHIKEALRTADEQHAEVVILRLNTPGGLVTSMREIIADVLASPVPLVGYVAPSGAHAASAGTYILYATHVAAMAPGTNIGAATPVEIGGTPPGLPGGNDGKSRDNKEQKSPASNEMAAKAINDAVAFIRSLAELRRRNADWAERAVREAATLSANGALAAGVIDVVARDAPELLARIDARLIEMPDGSKRRLATKGLPIQILPQGWLIRFLSVITDPNIAVILMLIGMYGLVFEFTSPGAIAPGVIGTISLLLGLYALNLLPIDYAGLALLLFGLAFLAVEAFNPTVVLGLGGLAAFLLGAAMLFKVQTPGYHLSWMIVGTAAALTFALSAFMGRALWALRKNPALVGAQAMRGIAAEVLDWSGNAGHVLAQGERWQARGEEGFTPGETAEVSAVQGLTLVVRRKPRTSSNGETNDTR